jgi:hypothetical protein
MKCPAEENANLERLPPTNVRKNLEKIGIKTNRPLSSLCQNSGNFKLSGAKWHILQAGFENMRTHAPGRSGLQKGAGQV